MKANKIKTSIRNGFVPDPGPRNYFLYSIQAGWHFKTGHNANCP